MAIANSEKTAKMKQAVAEVLAGRMDHKQAGLAYGLNYRSIYAAVKRERLARRRVTGLHPALRLFNSCQFVKFVDGVVK